MDEKTKEFNKITVGHVVQKYKKLKNGTFVCVGQDFVDGDVFFEDTYYGEDVEVDESKVVDCPMLMEQPKHIPFPE